MFGECLHQAGDIQIKRKEVFFFGNVFLACYIKYVLNVFGYVSAIVL